MVVPQVKFQRPHVSCLNEGDFNCKKPSKTIQNYTFLGNLPNALKTTGIYYTYTPDYYQFVSIISARAYSSGAHRFGFKGTEKDNENFEGAYDFGARIYDGRLGRWNSVDKMFAKAPWVTVYRFSFNSTISHFDSDGNYEIDASLKV